jgi:hypothetical protein
MSAGRRVAIIILVAYAISMLILGLIGGAEPSAWLLLMLAAIAVGGVRTLRQRA